MAWFSESSVDSVLLVGSACLRARRSPEAWLVTHETEDSSCHVIAATRPSREREALQNGRGFRNRVWIRYYL